MTVVLHKRQETLRSLRWNFFHLTGENVTLEAISGQQNIIAADISGQYESSLEPANLEVLQFVTSLLTKTMLQHVLFNIKTRIESWENYFPLSFTPPSIPLSKCNCSIFKKLICSYCSCIKLAAHPSVSHCA